MRDPARIDIVLDTIRAYWKEHPDLRLCQIIGNAVPVPSETYNTEDDVLLNALRWVHAPNCDWKMLRGWCNCPGPVQP